MKTVLLALLGAATLSAALPAVAGPDWAVIERARAEKRAQQRAEQQKAPCSQATAAPAQVPVAVPVAAPAQAG